MRHRSDSDSNASSMLVWHLVSLDLSDREAFQVIQVPGFIAGACRYADLFLLVLSVQRLQRLTT